jgi:hypothetical protein
LEPVAFSSWPEMYNIEVISVEDMTSNNPLVKMACDKSLAFNTIIRKHQICIGNESPFANYLSTIVIDNKYYYLGFW